MVAPRLVGRRKDADVSREMHPFGHSPAGVLEERQFSWVSGVLRGAARARSSISRRVSVSAEYSTTLRLMTVRCQPIYVTQQRDRPVACSLRLFFPEADSGPTQSSADDKNGKWDNWHIEHTERPFEVCPNVVLPIVRIPVPGCVDAHEPDDQKHDRQPQQPASKVHPAYPALT